MKNKKYKILVLSDLKYATSTTLKNSIGLAKLINGDVDFFHVKKPIDIIKNDNQLSASREINNEYKLIDKKIQKLVSPIAEQYNININHRYAIGNVKAEIRNYIKEYKPDIIVLGKRKVKPLKFIGDSITNYVLKEHDGVIMIAANNNAIEPNTKIALGVLNGKESSLSLDFSKQLVDNSKKPVKTFTVIKDSNSFKNTTITNNKNEVEYVFEKDENTVKNLSNYLSKNNINLLYIERERKESNKVDLVTKNVKNVVNNLDVSLLFTGKQNMFYNNN